MSFSSSYLPLLLLLYSFTSFTPTISSSRTTSAIPISIFNSIPHSDTFQRLSHLASTSIARAHHHKNPKNASASTTPLYPYGGAYSISLLFGTPPQSIPMIMDTGSSFSWFPCTKKYICKSCSVLSNGIPSFIPKQSSSGKVVGCMNPKCGWVHKSFNQEAKCRDCGLNKKNCSQICPPYIIQYGLGSTGGISLVETINLPNKKVQNFLVGCSLFSSNQPAGVAGFGRGISSFPSQLGLKKFSYCLVSQNYDHIHKHGSLVMDSESDSDKKTDNFTYTPLLKNPVIPGNAALSEYYYVGLRRITVGGHKVEVSYENLSPDSSGNGGTIVDSGSTFTYMNRAIFNAVANAFGEQVKEYGREKKMEDLTGLRPCFDVTGKKVVKLPELKLHFKGGGEMALPLENYFIGVNDGKLEAVCLSVVSDDGFLGPELLSGPSIILGNFFTQNYGIEFDLRNERFGFRKQFCS